jgi:hypothetical protein
MLIVVWCWMGERVRQTDLQNGAKRSPNWVIWAHSEVVHVKQKSYEGKIVLSYYGIQDRRSLFKTDNKPKFIDSGCIAQCSL